MIKKNANGQIILPYCEICAGIGIKRKLTKDEQDRFGNECQECVDHLRGMLDRGQKRIESGESYNGIVWTRQESVGIVMICDSADKAMKEMQTAGCVDCTKHVKDEILEMMKEEGIEPESVDHFDWEDYKGETFWHIVRP